MSNTDIATLDRNYTYTMPEYAYRAASDSANWVSPIDTTSYIDRIKEVQEQIDNLKNQMVYVLDEIEKLKSPVHFESLL